MDQLLIALDVESSAKAIALADNLRGVAGGFKIGSRLFTSEGPSIVRALTSRGDRVFLDLKFHDISNTVAQATAAATSLGVWMVNVHAAGGTRMMQAARDAAHETAQRERREPPLVIAVTMKWPRRFCCQQPSVSSLQNGCSSPLLTIEIRSPATPRLTR